MLDEGQNNFIASIYTEGNEYGLAVADISTGEIHSAQFTDPDDSTLKNELSRFAPNEIVFHPAFLDKKGMAEFIRNRLSCCVQCLREDQYDFSGAQSRVLSQFGKSNLAELSLDRASPFGSGHWRTSGLSHRDTDERCGSPGFAESLQ